MSESQEKEHFMNFTICYFGINQKELLKSRKINRDYLNKKDNGKMFSKGNLTSENEPYKIQK